MIILRMFDLHYNQFIFEVDELDEKEIEEIRNFFPGKLKIFFRKVKKPNNILVN
jgi:hypothetical protein